jgi:hypothetical protein
MFCSGCGHALAPEQAICPQCGRPAAPPVPPPTSLQFQLESYAGKVRVLGILWLVYAGITLVLGFAGLAFAKAFLFGGLGPWMHGPMSPDWFGPAWIHLFWIFLSVRIVLCVVAGWGLLERTQWGPIVAIIAAILCLIRIPLGTALGIATLIILLGYRNSALYEQL